MEKKAMEDLIQDFLDSGGEVVRLRYATNKDVSKAQRSMYHKDRACSGSDRSKKYLETQEKKESEMIFSKTDRWKE